MGTTVGTSAAAGPSYKSVRSRVQFPQDLPLPYSSWAPCFRWHNTQSQQVAPTSSTRSLSRWSLVVPSYLCICSLTVFCVLALPSSLFPDFSEWVWWRAHVIWIRIIICRISSGPARAVARPTTRSLLALPEICAAPASASARPQSLFGRRRVLLFLLNQPASPGPLRFVMWWPDNFQKFGRDYLQP